MRLGEPQGRSGRAENLVPTEIRCRTVQPVAQSLYRLSYPAHTSVRINFFWGGGEIWTRHLPSTKQKWDKVHCGFRSERKHVLANTQWDRRSTSASSVSQLPHTSAHTCPFTIYRSMATRDKLWTPFRSNLHTTSQIYCTQARHRYGTLINGQVVWQLRKWINHEGWGNVRLYCR